MDQEQDFDDTPTNLARPKTSATITLRVVKSFEYRTGRNLVIHDLNLLEMTVGGLKQKAREVIQSQPGWKPYRTVNFDTIKLYTRAHGAKTSNLIINLDHDEWILEDDSMFLADAGFENETEASFFNRELYTKFKENPQTRWD